MLEQASRKPVWQAEAANPETCETLRKALREVKDPELGLDIIQLGMIRDVEIRGNQVFIRMILTTPFCPYGPTMLDAAQTKAKQAVGLPVQMEMGEESWDKEMMEEGASLDWGLYP